MGWTAVGYFDKYSTDNMHSIVTAAKSIDLSPKQKVEFLEKEEQSQCIVQVY